MPLPPGTRHGTASSTRSPFEFHPVVLKGELFDAATRDAVAAFFATDPVDANANPVLAITTDYLITGDSDAPAVPTLDLRLTALRPDGALDSRLPRRLAGPVRATLAEVLFALNTDQRIEPAPAVHPFPWQHPGIETWLEGRRLSIHQTRHITVLAQEYMPTWIELLDESLLGSNADPAYRLSLASVVLPPADSAHARLERAGHMRAATAEWHQLFAGLIEHHTVAIVAADLDTARTMAF